MNKKSYEETRLRSLEVLDAKLQDFYKNASFMQEAFGFKDEGLLKCVRSLEDAYKAAPFPMIELLIMCTLLFILSGPEDVTKAMKSFLLILKEDQTFSKGAFLNLRNPDGTSVSISDLDKL